MLYVMNIPFKILLTLIAHKVHTNIYLLSYTFFLATTGCRVLLSNIINNINKDMNRLKVQKLSHNVNKIVRIAPRRRQCPILWSPTAYKCSRWNICKCGSRGIFSNGQERRPGTNHVRWFPFGVTRDGGQTFSLVLVF